MKGSMMERLTDWKQKHSSLIFYILLLVYPVTHWLIFYVGVNFNSFLLAFKKYDAISHEFKWVGLANFRHLWLELTEYRVLEAQLVNSLVVWFLTTFVGMLITLFFSYYIYKSYRMHNFYKIMLFIPRILPGIVLVMIYKIFVNEALPGYLAKIGIDISPLATVDSATRFPAAVFFVVLTGLGGQMLVYIGTMAQISPSITEAAMLDGITPMKELWYIVIPQVLPTITTYFIAGLAGIFSNGAGLLSFYGFDVFPQERTIGYHLFHMINGPGNGISQYGYASALGLCCSVIAAILTFTARHFLVKMED